MAANKPREQDPGAGEVPDDSGASEHAASGSSGTRGRGWREEIEGLVTRLLSDEELDRLGEHLDDDVGQVGDLVVAAHLDDMLFVERARYHRARRELGRALGSKDAELVATARQRLVGVTDSVALVRLQRDLASGAVRIPLVDDEKPDREPGKEPGQRADAD